MPRGRKPKPTALHVLHGNPSNLRHEALACRRAAEPPGGDAMPPPADFTDAQCEIWWDALANAPPGILRRIDISALVVWVIACDLHRRARDALNRSAMLVKPTMDPQSTALPVQSPFLAIINRQGVMMLRAAEQLGFTPLARPWL